MGCSSEDPNKGINGSVGGLIWVRRRNGSWWPGKILDPDELPEGSVPLPRSGTPIKLLGKEGSHVGWYNLEKSKRVKAFHYEDHDKCIEKFKASKYAKEDEAILHVLELELESARLGNNHADHDSPAESCPSEETEVPDKNSSSLSSSLGSGRKKLEKSRGLNDPEEKVSRRTKELGDLGMDMPLLALKRKRSKIANNHEISKKKNKRRTLTKALDSTAMISALAQTKRSNPNEASLFETKESKEKNSDINGVMCDDSLKSKPKEIGISSKVHDNESFGSLFDVPLVSKEKGSAGSPSTLNSSQQLQSRAETKPARNSRIKISSFQSKENNESSPSDSVANDNHPKWQSKGKRKARSRKCYPTKGAETRSVGTTTRRLIRLGPAEPSTARSLLYRQSRFTVNPKYDPSSFPKYNIPLEVRSGPDRPHRVPYVSLASKLTGCPIVGHPITVEVLADGSFDENLIRRKPNAGGPRHKAQDHGPPSGSSKFGKNGVLSKKTRKLSALTGPHRPGRDVKKGLVGKVKGPSVACVPLGVVFSRIHADLGGSG